MKFNYDKGTITLEKEDLNKIFRCKTRDEAAKEAEKLMDDIQMSLEVLVLYKYLEAKKDEALSK